MNQLYLETRPGGTTFLSTYTASTSTVRPMTEKTEKKPETKEPLPEAEILPFRAPPKRAPVRPAPGSPDNEGVEPLSNAALLKIGLLILFLVVTGVWLMNTLRDMGRLEDCAMQGRRNCVTISVPGR